MTQIEAISICDSVHLTFHIFIKLMLDLSCRCSARPPRKFEAMSKIGAIISELGGLSDILWILVEPKGSEGTTVASSS
jgi:hypothetical protein